MNSKPEILIVEDEAIVATDLAAKLHRHGYEVVGIVTGGKEAIEASDHLRPDLILMDIKLEGPMDGIQAAEGIHDRHDIPIIYLTAHSDPITLARAKLSDPFGYLIKPFDERELRIQIELALYKHKIDRQLRQQREWLRITLTSIGDAVIATDADGLISFMNPVAESLSGWKTDEVIGKPVTYVFHIVNEQTGEPLEDPFARVLREGRPMTIENHTALVNRDGQKLPIEDSAAPIRDSAGSVIGTVLVFHDVTQKRHDEDALRISENSLKRSQEIAHLGSWELDLGNNNLTWSDEVYRIFGLEPQEFGANYESFLEYVHPDDRSAVDAAYADSIRDQLDNYEIEHRVVRKATGEIRHVHERCHHIRDGAGRVIRSIGMVQDITERMMAQSALQRATQRYALLAETAGALLAAPDPQAVVEDLCRKVMVPLDCDVFINFLVDDTVKQMRLNAFAGLTEEDAKKIKWIDYNETGCGCVNRDRMCIITKNIQNPMGRFIDLVTLLAVKAFCCHPIISKGKLIGTLLFGTKERTVFNQEDLDLMRAVADQVAVAIERIRTERELRVSDEKLRSVLDHSLDAIFRFNKQTDRYDYFSPASRSIYGYSPDELMGMDENEMISHVHPDDRAKKENDLQRIESTGEGTTEFRWRNSAGEYRWLSVSLGIVRDQAGKPLYQDGIARDITENKDALEDLKRMNEDLKQFAYIASHDLQEPLRIMSSYSKLLKKRYGDKLDDDAGEFIGYIVESATRMQVMIRDLLIYSRSSQKELKTEDVDLNDVLEKIMIDLSDTIDSQKAKVSADDLPVIRTDRDSVTHLFQNLLSNALKFHGQEPPVVCIKADNSNGEWIFSVRDNGIGIDPSEHQKIFQIFYRLHSRDHYPGTGVGLTISKIIVDRLGGRIWVESHPGAGSTFFIGLPQEGICAGEKNVQPIRE